jgi:hypothetical protein
MNMPKGLGGLRTRGSLRALPPGAWLRHRESEPHPNSRRNVPGTPSFPGQAIGVASREGPGFLDALAGLVQDRYTRN